MTIKDIARLAGCGVSTVSRALNGSSEISDATRARINEVIQKYNYTPNGNARRMRQTAPNSVLLIVNGSSNLFFSPLIEQIQTAAESAGLQLVVNYIDEQEDEVQTAAQLCVEQKPAGIIFLGGDIRNFRRSFAGISVPCVLSTASAKELGFANLSSVSVDDVDGGRMAAGTSPSGTPKHRDPRRRSGFRSIGSALFRIRPDMRGARSGDSGVRTVQLYVLLGLRGGYCAVSSLQGYVCCVRDVRYYRCRSCQGVP